MSITEEQLAEWERRALEAPITPLWDQETHAANALFMSAARAAVPALIAEVRRLREVIAEWKRSYDSLELAFYRASADYEDEDRAALTPTDAPVVPR
jgi:hypothetical protein